MLGLDIAPAEGSNSGPQACLASASPTESSLQLPEYLKPWVLCVCTGRKASALNCRAICLAPLPSFFQQRGVHVHVTAHMCRSVLSFHHGGPRYGIQAARFGNKHLYLASHHISPFPGSFWKKLQLKSDTKYNGSNMED